MHSIIRFSPRSALGCLTLGSTKHFGFVKRSGVGQCAFWDGSRDPTSPAVSPARASSPVDCRLRRVMVVKPSFDPGVQSYNTTVPLADPTDRAWTRERAATYDRSK